MSAMRARYSVEEDERILHYIIENNLFNRVKGNVMWEGMEIALRNKVFCRTWSSMKERYNKHIVHHLSDYKLDPINIRQLLEPFNIQEELDKSPKKEKKSLNRKLYSAKEDKILIINIRKMRGNISGNNLWKSLEDKKVLEGRSWSSMRNRFLNYISGHLNTLTDVETANLLRRRMKGDRSAAIVEESSSVEQKLSEGPPVKKSQRKLLSSVFKEHFKSPPQRDTPQRLEARLTHVNRRRGIAQEPQPGPSTPKQASLCDLESRRPVRTPPSRRKSTDLSTASAGKRRVRNLPSESSENRTRNKVDCGSGTVSVASTPVASHRTRSGKETRRNPETPADATTLASRTVKAFLEDNTTVAVKDSQELIGYGSDSSSEKEIESDDELETFIDPLYASFVDNASFPFIVVDGVKVKINDLAFPIVDVFC